MDEIRIEVEVEVLVALSSQPPQISVHTTDVKRVFPAFSVQVSASAPADLSEKDIVVRLRKVGLSELLVQCSSWETRES